MRPSRPTHRSTRRRTHAVVVLAIGALALTGLTACGSDADDASATPTASSTATTSAPATSTTAPADDVVAIDITMTGSKVDPAPGVVKVDKGSKVELTVTRDTDGEIHVHGYELEEDAKAGEPATFTFVADQAGTFEVEAHDPDRLLTKLEVS